MLSKVVVIVESALEFVFDVKGRSIFECSSSSSELKVVFILALEFVFGVQGRTTF